jgi:hypothetical protein
MSAGTNAFAGHDGRTERLIAALSDAEDAARSAATALLDDLVVTDPVPQASVSRVAEYVRSCRDPFQALDIARLLGALVADLSMQSVDVQDLTEWAYAEIRLTALVARTCRLLRDEREGEVEEAVFGLGTHHLEKLEQSPRYLSIFTEMARILDTGVGVEPRSAVSEFLGLARTPWRAVPKTLP